MLLENSTADKYSFWEFKGNLETIDKWFLMSTPVPVLTITLVYLIFVKKIGPELMKNRTPFNLNSVLVIYNVLQVWTSFLIFYRGFNILFQNGMITQRKCLSENESLKMHIAALTYHYFITKLTELLDTVFFVLRKNNRQITFLHVYHHTVMVLISWFTLKYEPTYSTLFLGSLNSFIHVIMYAYYGLTAIPGMAKYLWWKKYITKMQMMQFIIITIHSIVSNKLSSCPPSYIIFTTVIFNALLFLYLFVDFYMKTYHNNNGKCSTRKYESLKAVPHLTVTRALWK